MIQDRLQPPEIAGGLGPIAVVEDALVVPPAKGLGNQSVQRSGVLRPDGSLVPESVTWRGSAQVTVRPPMPAGPVETLGGSWLFLGPLFGHFGHFLVESIARLWALDRLRGAIEGALFVPKFQNRPEHVMATYRPFLEALGLDVPVRNLEEPARVERLHVPPQGFGMFQMIEGSPEFRAYMRAHAGRGIAPQGHPKIYISRSALPVQRGSILAETVLEEHLKAEGYVPFHPQKHGFADQIAAYKAATHVVGVDCSPFHLLALVGHRGQNVGIIARRDGDLDRCFARQIHAFQGAEVAAINHLRRNWIEDHAHRPSRTSWGEVDFPALGATLRECGLIAGGDWPAIPDEAIRHQIDRIGAAQGTRFKPWEGPPGTAPGDAD
ncbi:DUF563 domain-containing protein [Rubellimicrobium sp. CFH 75288]|uniref:glycosyltransferase family 61 protein n=1 Tax=Rubellimicrobium sp. CFH 75288 TaxID=2697034 RepID=UPI0014503F22|nr:glycosyltransferase family 61 protein [Rubellimicrobium sp. CFH 75288]NAZ35580.1 DUF563 domain-containing protein [Rubellimicrobium sp. CFH 75288]